MCGDTAMEEQFGFETDLDLEEDIQAEPEDFLLLARLGFEDEALHLARTVLWRHIHHFPVFAEVAGFLLEHKLNNHVQELMTEMNERDIHFQLEEQQAFSRLIHELSAQILDYTALLLQQVDEEAASSSYQPISPIKVRRESQVVGFS